MLRDARRMLLYKILYYTIHIILFYTILYSTLLYYTIYTILHYIIPYHTILDHTNLHFIVLCTEAAGRLVQESQVSHVHPRPQLPRNSNIPFKGHIRVS